MLGYAVRVGCVCVGGRELAVVEAVLSVTERVRSALGFVDLLPTGQSTIPDNDRGGVKICVTIAHSTMSRR